MTRIEQLLSELSALAREQELKITGLDSPKETIVIKKDIRQDEQKRLAKDIVMKHLRKRKMI